MISARSEFKLLDRGFDKTLLLIPGWATNYRIFSKLNCAGYNYLFVVSACLGSLPEDTRNFLEKSAIEKVSVLGYSLGGFIAKEFALRFPEKTEELFLVSIRKKYTVEEISSVSESVRKNKTAFLIKFYKDCFCRQGCGFDWFKENLLETYLEKFETCELLEGLEYLSKSFITPEDLSRIGKVAIFNSRIDNIAPFSEAQELAGGSSLARFVALENSGHIPFLGGEFNEKFNG